MAPLSLKVILDEGAVTRTVKFDSAMTVEEAQVIVREKILVAHDGKDYGLFLTSADDDKAGVWLEARRNLEYYMLRDGDQLYYLRRVRNLRVRMLDGSEKTLQVDESKTVEQLMIGICARIGITNHDEYGLCYIGADEEDNKSNVSGMGTLTLRRHAQQREKDAQLEQLSKKLKTDDHVEWLEHKKTLRELGVDPRSTVLLKRRLFFSDRNVDSRDPVQLNLLYVQARDAILQGRHPVTEDQAVKFAGIQCQIHYGDFQEDKHKPGLIENLSEYLPEQYVKSWGLEKKILKEFRTHQGLSPIDAKYLYTKTARDLPTYGVTFFLVKEKQKGKKKLVPRLLGINAESILRLDEVTKEILQVWPLTQVKTYHAGKSETFTLNFGDYSDKEYSVKTNDALRIRDILQDYIEIIRRRMDAKYHADLAEHHIICEDNVSANKGHFIEHVKHSPNKIFEETFVGPSKIISYEPGQQMSHGTHIVTVQQIVVSSQGGNQQNIMKGEVPLRGDMSLDCIKKLNRLNSGSVAVVTLLTEPNESKTAEAASIVKNLEENMPSLVQGVKEAAEKQPTEDAKKKLLDEIQELCNCMKTLSETVIASFDPDKAQETGRRIADLSTQMYFSLDPRTKRRSQLCLQSRKSFIQDEKVDAKLRRASALAASHSACAAIENAKEALIMVIKPYTGSPLSPSDAQELDRAAAEKMDKLNAAVALYLTAYSDPSNIDYATAVNSMNTINELLPEITNDINALRSIDPQSGKALTDQFEELLDSLKNICNSTDPDDHQKLQNAASAYGDVSNKLMFTFKRGDKQNEVIALAKNAGDKASALLSKADELTPHASEEEADKLHNTCERTALAARDLIICAQLTAPSLHEAHCRSALSASSEQLSGAAQQLALHWRPVAERAPDSRLGEHLRDRTMDLAKALDQLKQAYATLDGLEDNSDEARERKRLKFITTTSGAKKNIDAAKTELDKPTVDKLQKGSEEEMQERLAQRMAQLNAALAALVAATADRDNPDYATADLAIATISDLMPEIVREGKALGSTKNDADREELLAQLRALCDATSLVCDASQAGDVGAVSGAAARAAGPSGRLVYVFSPRAASHKDDQVRLTDQIVDTASAASRKASELLLGVNQLAQQLGGDKGAQLDGQGATVADLATALLTAAQLTAPSIEEPRCQASLLSSVDALSAASQQLAGTWRPLAADPARHGQIQDLDQQHRLLQQELDRLREACRDATPGSDADTDGAREKMRLKFIATTSRAKKNIDAAETELQKKPDKPEKGTEEELKKKLAERMAQLNAALASLVAATADRDKPDYRGAQLAVDAISELVPQVVREGASLSSAKDSAARGQLLAQLRALCDSARRVCDASHAGDMGALNSAAARAAASSGKLMYVFKPHAARDKENQIVDTASAASRKASELLLGVNQLAQQLGGDKGAQLDGQGAKVADLATALLTAAQLTAPSIEEPRCQASLLGSVDALSAASQQLAGNWRPLASDPALQGQIQDLDKQQRLLQQELDRLKDACRDATPGGGAPESAGLKFSRSVAAARHAAAAAQRELDKPLVKPKHAVPVDETRRRLHEGTTRLNAALAALVAALADRERPNYEAAERAIATINHQLPQLVKESKSLAASGEDAPAGLLGELRALCDATSLLGDGLSSPEELNNSASQLAGVTSKLVYIFDPRASPDKENEIVEVASRACEQASQLLGAVNMAAAEVGGPAGQELDTRGCVLADAANALLTTAQLTAPCIEDPSCRSALVAAADKATAAASALASSWKPLASQPLHSQHVLALDRLRQQLDADLDAVRRICRPSREKPPVPKRGAPAAPAAPAALATPAAPAAPATPATPLELTKHFLDHLRQHESCSSDTRPPVKVVDMQMKKKEDDLVQRQHLLKAADKLELQVQKGKDDIAKVVGVCVAPAVPPERAVALQRQIEARAASAAAAAAALAAAHNTTGLDHASAAQASRAMAVAVPRMVEDAIALRGALDQEERQAFLVDLLALLDAVRVLADAAKNKPKKLTEAAVAYGDRSCKLLYVVSTDVDPGQQKEVLSRATEIGQSVSQLLAGAAPAAMPQAAAAARAAGSLAYTAKLVAPAIQHPQCQQALMKATSDLSGQLTAFSDTLESVPGENHTQVKRDSDRIQKMLRDLLKDLEEGKLVKRKPVERIVVEHTPLRLMACSVLEDAKKRAEQTSTPLELKHKLVKYANELAQAVSQLDQAYHRCTKAPQDMDKRNHLENAIQQLQVCVLQNRPSLQDQPQNNIVDLTDYVREVSDEAGKLQEVTGGSNELGMVREHCAKIKEYAERIMYPQHNGVAIDDGFGDDMNEVHQFAEDAERRTKTISNIVQGLKDGKQKDELQGKAAQLNEAVNMLNFASNSALATTQSVSLDATLEELVELEGKLDEICGSGEEAPYDEERVRRARTRLTGACAASRPGRDLAPAVAAYAAAVRSKPHAQRVCALVRQLALTTGRHLASWQRAAHPETAALRRDILQELDQFEASKRAGKKNALSEVDLTPLLLPPAVQVPLDHKSRTTAEELSLAASKLTAASGNVLASAHDATQLARSAAAVLPATALLAARAAHAAQDSEHAQQIEDASKEMSLQTYNMLKAAEVMSEKPNNYAARRRLMDACALLNDAINNLVSTCERAQGKQGNAVRAACAALRRRAALGAHAHAGVHAASAPHGYEAALAHTSALLERAQAINTDEALSPAEFARTLSHAAHAAAAAEEYATHCAYLLLLPEGERQRAAGGFADAARARRLAEAVEDAARRLVLAGPGQASAEAPVLVKHVQDFQQCAAECAQKVEPALQERLQAAGAALQRALGAFSAATGEPKELGSSAMRVVDATMVVCGLLDAAATAPAAAPASDAARTASGDVLTKCRELNNKLVTLLRDVEARGGSDEAPETMTWVTFGSSRRSLMDAFRALLDSLQQNGKKAGILELSQAEIEEELKKSKQSHVQIQLELARKWLGSAAAPPAARSAGQLAAAELVDLGREVCAELSGQDKEEMQQLVDDSAELLANCTAKYDAETASALLDRLSGLKKAIEQGVVARVVTGFLHDEPLHDLDLVADAETDESKRKQLLERKIAELLAALGRVKRAAQLVASSAAPQHKAPLLQGSRQTELLAPMLVKAAQQRVASPDDQAAIAEYQRLLAEYTESLANLRGLCDQALDPMDFVQAAGETMQKMKEETESDPQNVAHASTAITKLANRVLTVSMSSAAARHDPELRNALIEARRRLAPITSYRHSKDWRDHAAQVLRTTGEVESALGGEMIFKKQQTTDQPIFSAALGLHAAVREWSSKDNDVVAAARRMAVLMAKLAHHVDTENKSALVWTARAIVAEAAEVARLARLLARECTDARINANLLQVCERIPTISGQLKMLATVKGSSLGHQDSKEDQEAMNMLVDNAQNLMTSIQEVVKAAASASVKIMSQRGGARVRWVRSNYY